MGNEIITDAERRELQSAKNAKEYAAAVQNDAARYLLNMLGEQQAKVASARVSMAFAAAARSAKDPSSLYGCSRASIVAAIAQSALANLMPGGQLANVWLVPKGGELQWWLSHRGMATLALRAGYQIIAVPVHVDDEVVVQFGEVVNHNPRPDSWPEDLDQLLGVYLTIRRLSDGASLGRPWMPAVAIRRRRKNGGPVWSAWPIEMAQKTCIRWAMARGYVPIESVELQMAIDAEPTVTDEPEEAEEIREEAPPTSGQHRLGVEMDEPAPTKAPEVIPVETKAAPPPATGKGGGQPAASKAKAAPKAEMPPSPDDDGFPA